MRRTGVITIVAAVFVAMALTATGCASGAPGSDPPVRAVANTGTGDQPAGDWPAGAKEAEVYVAVLRRYVGTPAENSSPDKAFTTIYVLDRSDPHAGDPKAKGTNSTPIPLTTQRQVTAALAEVGRVAFIADKETVLDREDGCARVKNHGILITLSPPNGDDNRVEVGINGFFACLGATWLTYVVTNDAGTGWRVTGTTGVSAIA